MRKKSERTELEIVRAIERTRHVARALSLPFVDLAAYRVSPGILRKIPLETAERHRCVPIVWNHRRVILACAEPADVAWLLSRPEEVGCARVGWPVADEDDEIGSSSEGTPLGAERVLEFALATRDGIEEHLERRREIPVPESGRGS